MPEKYGQFRPSSLVSPPQVLLVPWNTSEGQARFEKCRFKNAFVRLAGYYQPQANAVYCGVASLVMALNALSQPDESAPLQPEISKYPKNDPLPFHAYSQNTFLNEGTDKIKPRGRILGETMDTDGNPDVGLNLTQLGQLAEHYGFDVAITTAADQPFATGLKGFRDTLKKNCGPSDTHTILHFRCGLLGGAQFGHISPAAAWDEDSDTILVLDTGGHLSPWFWAPVEPLYKSMRETYRTQPAGGGFVTIRSKKP